MVITPDLAVVVLLTPLGVIVTILVEVFTVGVNQVLLELTLMSVIQVLFAV
jgi:hypothetical protein